MNTGLTIADIVKIVLASATFSLIVTFLLRVICVTIYNVVVAIRDWLFWRW